MIPKAIAFLMVIAVSVVLTSALVNVITPFIHHTVYTVSQLLQRGMK